MKFFEKGAVRLRYQEKGTGFPLLIINGGGLDSTLDYPTGPFEPATEFQSDYRCITMDLRNSNLGQSTGPLEADRPWDMHADDQLALLDHLGVGKFAVMGFCIGNPFIWNLLKRVPDRIPAVVTAQPVAVDPERHNHFYNRNMAKWGAELCRRRPDITADAVQKFLSNMFEDADFVITASREFVSGCDKPILIMPDQTPSHPYATAMEMARLAPKAEVSHFPWNDTPDGVRWAIRHIRTFLRAYCPGAGA